MQPPLPAQANAAMHSAAADLDFELTEGRFSTRAAVIVFRSGPSGKDVLVCREPGLEVCYLPGGRIKAGEDSYSAAQREFWEETQQLAGPLQLVLVQEAFLERSGRPHHVLAFYYLAGALPNLPATAFANHSEAEHWLEWVPVTQLEQARLVPVALRPLLLAAELPSMHHVIDRFTLSDLL